jgi:hypothetical protein
MSLGWIICDELGETWKAEILEGLTETSKTLHHEDCSACSLFLARCLLYLLFDLEDGSSTLLLKVGKLLSDYMVSFPRTQPSLYSILLNKSTVALGIRYCRNVKYHNFNNMGTIRHQTECITRVGAHVCFVSNRQTLTNSITYLKP